MYTEYFINLNRNITDEESEIIIALLSQAEFESFETAETGVKAYIQTSLIQKQEIENIIFSLKQLYELEVEIKEMENVNWNAEWEKDYEPVFVNDSCVIRAPFHKITPQPEFDIVIEPKMAFGTGHHETTFLISNILFSEKLKNKAICDAGTGSGVLSIIASMLGAKSIFAYDIDLWSYNNTKENIKINKISNIEVKQGDVSLINKRQFDLLLANINRNILLKDISQFSSSLNDKGTLIVSGFYTQDLPIIKKVFEENKLKLDSFTSKNNWIAAIFRKQ